jgi:hypothetical protein
VLCRFISDGERVLARVPAEVVRSPGLGHALLARVVFLAFIAVVVGAWAYAVTSAWRVSAAARHCDHLVGVARVVVPRSSVVYARANGWPRVIVQGDRLGSPVDYDHGPEAARVRAAVVRLCDGARYRLVAR